MRWVMMLALLAACDNLSGGKAIQPEMTARANETIVVVHPHWVAREQVAQRCPPGMLACTTRTWTDAGWHAHLTAVHPRDFNDFNAIETVGHECLHAMGATHQ